MTTPSAPSPTRAAWKTSAFSVGEQRSTSPSAVTSSNPRTKVASPPNVGAGPVGGGRDRAGDGLAVDVAEVRQREVPGGELLVEAMDAHPRLDGHGRGGLVDVDDPVEQVEGEHPPVGARDVGERVAAAHDLDPLAGPAGPPDRLHDLELAARATRAPPGRTAGCDPSSATRARRPSGHDRTGSGPSGPPQLAQPGVGETEVVADLVQHGGAHPGREVGLVAGPGARAAPERW